MLTRCLRVTATKVAQNQPYLRPALSRYLSTDEKVERSPAAPGGGQIYRPPDVVFEEGDPLPVTFEDVSRATYRIQSGIKRTACVESKALSELCGCKVWIKKDFMQFTGSFKERLVCRCIAYVFSMLAYVC